MNQVSDVGDRLSLFEKIQVFFFVLGIGTAIIQFSKLVDANRTANKLVALELLLPEIETRLVQILLYDDSLFLTVEAKNLGKIPASMSSDVSVQLANCRDFMGGAIFVGDTNAPLVRFNTFDPGEPAIFYFRIPDFSAFVSDNLGSAAQDQELNFKLLMRTITRTEGANLFPELLDDLAQVGDPIVLDGRTINTPRHYRSEVIFLRLTATYNPDGKIANLIIGQDISC